MFGCDHATKAVAEARLQHAPPVELVSGVLDLQYAANHDVAFGLFARLGLTASPTHLLTMAAVTLLVLGAAWAHAFRAGVATAAQHVGFALAVSGALGNVVDRVARGYVVDFIHLRRWPIFNVADVAVVAGMILLALASFRRPREGPLSASGPLGPEG